MYDIHCIYHMLYVSLLVLLLLVLLSSDLTKAMFINVLLETQTCQMGTSPDHESVVNSSLAMSYRFSISIIAFPLSVLVLQVSVLYDYSVPLSCHNI